MIRTILWDIDGTLLDFEAASRRAMTVCFEHFGFGAFDGAMFDEYTALNDYYWQELEAGHMEKKRILVERFEVFFRAHGISPDRAVEYDNYYREHLSDKIVYCRHAEETIMSLTGRFRQYGVTNGTRELQHRKLTLSGLDRLLDGTFISEEVGYEKPDVRFFEYVFNEIGRPDRDEIIIVGDSVTSDMRGGLNVGIRTCLYDPSHKKRITGIDYCIDDLAEITEIL